jgi:hypothetical protein
MSTAAMWLDERAAAAVAAWQARRRLPPSFGVGMPRYLVQVLDDRCDGGRCLCVCRPKAWQRGCPVSDLPAAPPWRPDREPAR